VQLFTGDDSRDDPKRHLLSMASAMAGVGYWLYSPLDGRISWSEQVYAIHGVSPDSFDPNLGQAVGFYHPDDRPVLETFLQRAVEEGVGFNFRLRLIRADGVLRHVTSKGECERDAAGMVTSIFGVFQDVTDHVNALEQAENAAWRAGLAEQIAGLGHWRVEYPSQTLTWSEQMYAIYGLENGSPVEVERIMEMVHPEDRELTRNRLEGDIRGETVAKRPLIRIVRPDGAIRWVQGDTRLERGPDGQPLALFGTLRDVTRETEAEQRLEESEARYRRLADHATDVIVLIGQDAVIEYVSPSCSTFGYAPEDLIGRRTIDLVHPADLTFATQTVTSLLNGEPIDRSLRREYRLRCKDGGYRWIEGRPSLIPGGEDGLPRILTVYRDVTLRRELEDELMVARAEAEQAAAVKSEFLANMSHELRTPLTSILGFSDLLDTSLTDNPQSSLYASRIRQAADALLTAVNDILDFSKLEAGQVEIEARRVELAAFVEETTGLLEPQAARKGIALICDTSAAPGAAVMLDNTRLRQILLNLISNAVKFTGAGSVTIAVTEASQRLLFEVRDTGSGIPAERLDRLFKRFSQVDASTTRVHGGTGLGLAICKGLVEAMGGSIGVRSVLGEGSVFHFDLPLVEAPAVEGGADDLTDADNALDGLRLLVVDDNPANRELVRLIGNAVGLEVTEADCGETAIGLARSQPVDFILMDMRMPGMDGETAARTIASGGGPNARTPILMFSADAITTTGRADSPFAGMIAKPLSPAALLQGLRDALDGPPQTAQAHHG
jgi:PAS domain S-box-containing protein